MKRLPNRVEDHPINQYRGKKLFQIEEDDLDELLLVFPLLTQLLLKSLGNGQKKNTFNNVMTWENRLEDV